MTPLAFSRANRKLVAPECGDLPALVTAKEVYTCWRPTWLERLSILFFGRVWLSVLTGGGTQPPVMLLGKRDALPPLQFRQVQIKRSDGVFTADFDRLCPGDVFRIVEPDGTVDPVWRRAVGKVTPLEHGNQQVMAKTLSVNEQRELTGAGVCHER